MQRIAFLNSVVLSAMLTACAAETPAEIRPGSLPTGSHAQVEALARFHQPGQVAVDTVGTVYVADAGENRVYRVTPDGQATAIAGNGGAGFAGDGGLATQASLNAPTGIALDRIGNVYVADRGNQRVRRIGLDGRISTVAGVGPGMFEGDGGPATKASLGAPEGLAVDPWTNFLYIADSGHHVIRRVDGEGRITTVAGQAAYRGLFQIGGFAGDGGAATAARLNAPRQVAVGLHGELFIADTLNHRIRQVDTDGNIHTIVGTGAAASSGDGGLATNAAIAEPQALAVSPYGDLYIAEAKTGRIRGLSPDGRIRTVVNFNQLLFAQPSIRMLWEQSLPAGLAVSNSGTLFVSDRNSGQLAALAL